MDEQAKEQSKKVVMTSQKEVPITGTKSEGIQIHFGNVKVVELKLLETINTQLAEILILMREKSR